MLSKICGIFLGVAVLTLIATQYFIRSANFGNGNFSSYILASFKMMVKSLCIFPARHVARISILDILLEIHIDNTVVPRFMSYQAKIIFGFES